MLCCLEYGVMSVSVTAWVHGCIQIISRLMTMGYDEKTGMFLWQNTSNMVKVDFYPGKIL
jgi:hypothetical protein